MTANRSVAELEAEIAKLKLALYQLVLNFHPWDAHSDKCQFKMFATEEPCSCGLDVALEVRKEMMGC